jgi:hypothetical protein
MSNKQISHHGLECLQVRRDGVRADEQIGYAVDHGNVKLIDNLLRFIEMGTGK